MGREKGKEPLRQAVERLDEGLWHQLERFRELITALIDTDEPRMYNYAVLDLADQVCMKKRLP
jgi:adenine-specific DNA glycosylase